MNDANIRIMHDQIITRLDQIIKLLTEIAYPSNITYPNIHVSYVPGYPDQQVPIKGESYIPGYPGETTLKPEYRLGTMEGPLE